jgi:hypothetical protein
VTVLWQEACNAQSDINMIMEQIHAPTAAGTFTQ